jgi:hypothetical protein
MPSITAQQLTGKAGIKYCSMKIKSGGVSNDLPSEDIKKPSQSIFFALLKKMDFLSDGT